MNKPENWRREPLGRVATLIMGQSPDSRYCSEEEVGLPFLQGCAEFGARFPLHNICCTQPKKIGPASSVLFSVRAPVGRINIADRDYVIGRGLASITGTDISHWYLEHFLRFEEDNFQTASQGSTFQAINSSALSNWFVNFPTSLAEQSKIAEVLSTVDRAIAQTQALIAKQQRIKTGLMQDLLTRGIDEQGNLRNEETHKFQDSPLGRIPVEWEIKTINEVISAIDAGWSPSCPDEAPPEGEWGVLKVSAVSSGIYQPSESKRLPIGLNPVKALEVNLGDVLMTRANGVADLVGKCVLVEETPTKLMLSDKILRLCPIANQITPFILFSTLSSYTSRLQILALLSGSSGQKNISQSQIRSIVLRVPCVKEQERIEKILHAEISQINFNTTYLGKLFSVKTALMQDLLTGEKRVTPLLHS